VQLYEAIVCLALFAVLVRLSRRKRFDGEVILAYTLLYAIARFALEFFRGDADRGFPFGGLLSTSQFIAAILGPASIALWLVRRRSAQRAKATVRATGTRRTVKSS
jgi:phosphatidylglycerol---prolipoprotein diacylglyceryl transferase